MRGVTANKLRSALTTLGILIGVAAVIILVAVGTGSSKAVQDSISKLGSNTLTVTAGSPAAAASAAAGGRPGWRRFAGGCSAADEPTHQPRHRHPDPHRRSSRWPTPRRWPTSRAAPDVARRRARRERRVRRPPPTTGATHRSAPSPAPRRATCSTTTTPSHGHRVHRQRLHRAPQGRADRHDRRRDLVGGDGSRVVGKTVDFNGIAVPRSSASSPRRAAPGRRTRTTA